MTVVILQSYPDFKLPGIKNMKDEKYQVSYPSHYLWVLSWRLLYRKMNRTIFCLPKPFHLQFTCIFLADLEGFEEEVTE